MSYDELLLAELHRNDLLADAAATRSPRRRRRNGAQAQHAERRWRRRIRSG